MTGMPAWGKSMDDRYVWGVVAFLNELPGMTADRYRELVEASGGHQHGGLESGMEAKRSASGHVDNPSVDDHSKAPPHEH